MSVKQTREKTACRELDWNYVNWIRRFFSKDHQFNQATNHLNRWDSARFATTLETINNSIDRVFEDIKKTMNRVYSKFCSSSVFDADSSLIHTSWTDLSSNKHNQSTWDREDDLKHRSNRACIDLFKKKNDDNHKTSDFDSKRRRIQNNMSLKNILVAAFIAFVASSRFINNKRLDQLKKLVSRKIFFQRDQEFENATSWNLIFACYNYDSLNHFKNKCRQSIREKKTSNC